MRMKLLLARLPILGLSFVLALTLYLFVQTQNSPTKGPVTVMLKVRAENPNPQLFAYVPTQFQATVSGPTDAVDQFVNDPSQTYAVFDLSGAAAGQFDAPVRVVAPSNVRLQFAYRRSARVKVVPIVEHTDVIVTAGSTNQLPPNLKNYRLSKFEISPDTVTLRGPADQIEGITAKVIVDLSQVESVSYQRSVQVQLLDSQGAYNHVVTVEPAVVMVTPVLVALPQTKQIILNAQFTGLLKPGLSIDSYTISPQVITVSGQSEELARILTAPVMIHLPQLQPGEQTLHLTPVLPHGIAIVRQSKGASAAVTVTVQVSRNHPTNQPTTPTAETGSDGKPGTSGGT